MNAQKQQMKQKTYCEMASLLNYGKIVRAAKLK